MESLVTTCSVEARPSVQGNFLNKTRFCGQSKTTLRNKAAKKYYDAKKIINVEIKDSKFSVPG